ncbi:MAG: hydrolase, partial [Parcubacteria group bacterium GW2011_GWC2_45_7]
MLELIYNSEKPYDLQRDYILDWIKSKQGRYFGQHIVDAFIEACKPERFWLDIENISTNPDVLTRVHPSVQEPMSLSIIKSIAVVFAVIIDKKSTFTHE